MSPTRPRPALALPTPYSGNEREAVGDTTFAVGMWSDDGFGQQPVNYVCHHIRARATVQLAQKCRPGGIQRGVAGAPVPPGGE
jgi:hypothetical protein